MKILIFLVALAYVNAAGASPQPIARPHEKASQQEKGGSEDAPDNIGTATMRKDGTIVLSLIYSFPQGGHTTPAKFIYKPGHPEYKSVLRHLGGMKPGESKGVKPWPTTMNTPPPDLNAPLSPELKDFTWPKK